MKRALAAGTVVCLALVIMAPASAHAYRNFVSLTGGVNSVWNPFLLIFDGEYDIGYGGSLGYGTRFGRASHWAFYGAFSYDHTESEGGLLYEGHSTWEYYNLAANVRYYFGDVSEGSAGYVGLGPGVLFLPGGGDSGAVFNMNASIGGDFAVGHGWSIIPDLTMDLAMVKVHLGLGYWFM